MHCFWINHLKTFIFLVSSNHGCLQFCARLSLGSEPRIHQPANRRSCQRPLTCACKGLNWGASKWWCKSADLTNSGFFSFMSLVAGIHFFFFLLKKEKGGGEGIRKTTRKANKLLSDMYYILYSLLGLFCSTCCFCAARASAYRLGGPDVA